VLEYPAEGTDSDVTSHISNIDIGKIHAFELRKFLAYPRFLVGTYC